MHEQVVDSIMHTINGGMTTAGFFGMSRKKKAAMEELDKEEGRKADEEFKLRMEERNKKKMEQQKYDESIIQRNLTWAAIDKEKKARDLMVTGDEKLLAVKKTHNEKIAEAIEFLRINGIKTTEPPSPDIEEALARLEEKKNLDAMARYPHHFWK